MEFWWIWLFVIFNPTFLILAHYEMRRRRIFTFLKSKKKGDIKMALPNFIKELVNKEVLIQTINGNKVGIIMEIQDNWVKLTDRRGRDMFIKDDMISAIDVLPSKNPK